MSMSEDDIIQLFFPAGRVERLDDCSLIPDPESHIQLITTDALVERTHFRLDWSGPEDLAIKLFHVNLSDLISSGGRARWALLSMGVPENIPDDFLRRFAGQLRLECREQKCDLIGGDTYRAPHLHLNLTLGGVLKRSEPLVRGGGRPGDVLYVTGDLGRSLAGYRDLIMTLDLHKEAGVQIQQLCRQRHLQPRSRYDIIDELMSKAEIHAMMDISDGLYADAMRLARASDVHLRIEVDKIPVLPEIQKHITAMDAMVSGEELELMFLAPPGLNFPAFRCTAVGEAVSPDQLPVAAGNASMVVLTRNDKIIRAPVDYYQHFQSR